MPFPRCEQTYLPDGTLLGSSVYHGLPDMPSRARDSWSVSMVPQFAAEGDVDFIAPASVMKELFALPYSNAAVRGAIGVKSVLRGVAG